MTTGSLGKRANAGFAAVLLILLGIGIVSYINTATLVALNQRVTHTYQVLASLENVLSLLKDSETGQRGYLLTGDPTYLEPYSAANLHIAQEIANLQQLTSDNPLQQASLSNLDQLITERLMRLKETLELRDREGLDAAITNLRANQGKASMDGIRTLVANMRTSESKLLSERKAAARSSATQIEFVISTGIVLAVLLIVLASYIISRDINHRKTAQLQLEQVYRDSEQARGEIRAVLDAVSEVVILMSPEGRFLSVNRRLTSMLGLNPAQVLGQTTTEVSDLLQPIFGTQPALEQLPSPADDQRQFTQLVEQIWPVRRELDIYTTPVHSAAGVHIGRLYMLRDVTHEREINRMKSDFVAMVSHELRTPLTSIKGYTELLIDGEVGELAEQQIGFLQIVRHNADRLIGLINDFLDISRIESGNTELKPSLVDLTILIQQVAGSFRPQLQQKQQQLALELAPDLPAVLADQDRVIQILTNLLSNAHKYTPSGGAISICTQQQERFIQVQVKDSGIGLAAEEQAQIFDKFFRVHNRTTQEAGGTGLGLSITRSLIEMHGGSIQVASRPGEGAEFSFTLPLAAQSSLPAEPSQPALPGHGCILVVDDEPDIANLLRRYLERASYRVLIAHTAADALQLARTERPDLITLDVVLPDSDGFTVLEWLKSDPSTQSIPVIMVSALADSRSGGLLGAVEYLVKPVGDQVLLERINHLLASDRQRPVLVADDNADIRGLLVSYLRRAGYQVIEARDGDEAVQLTRTFQPGVVLMDINMPVLDGISALRQLRADPATRNLPIIMMTASPGMLEKHQSTIDLLGGSRLLSKPCTPAELAAAITEGLRASQRPQAPDRGDEPKEAA